MANPPSGNIVARRVTDDLIAFSGESSVPKYMKYFLVHKLAETRRFLNRMREEVDSVRSCVGQLTALVAELEAMDDDDDDEVREGLLAAKDSKRAEDRKLVKLNEIIAEAEEEIETLEFNAELLDGDDDDV